MCKRFFAETDFFWENLIFLKGFKEVFWFLRNFLFLELFCSSHFLNFRIYISKRYSIVQKPSLAELKMERFRPKSEISTHFPSSNGICMVFPDKIVYRNKPLKRTQFMDENEDFSLKTLQNYSFLHRQRW